MNSYDVVIVGGGITGVSILRDCALRGIKNILLIEKMPGLAQATSSVTTGLANRGLRYIDYDLQMTKISAQEVAILQFIAPNLLKPMPFLIPFFPDSKFNLELFETALESYDDITKKYGGPKHRRLSRKQTLERQPLLNKKIYGALVIEELLIQDSKLTQEIAEGAKRWGAKIITDLEVKEVKFSESGFVLKVGNDLGETRIYTKILCNATGPWAQKFAAKLNCSIPLRPTKGVHIILDLNLNDGLIIDTIDHRYPLTLITKSDKQTFTGPTDEDFFGKDYNPQNLNVSEDEIGYLFDAVCHVLPSSNKKQIVGAIKGVRPTLYQRGLKPEKLSRNFKIFDHEKDGLPGFISLAGGKFTIARLMAEKTTDLICQKLGIKKLCLSHLVPLNTETQLGQKLLLSSINHWPSNWLQKEPPIASFKKRVFACARLIFYFFKHVCRKPKSLITFIDKTA